MCLRRGLHVYRARFDREIEFSMKRCLERWATVAARKMFTPLLCKGLSVWKFGHLSEERRATICDRSELNLARSMRTIGYSSWAITLMRSPSKHKSAFPGIFQNAAFWLVEKTERQPWNYFLFASPFFSGEGNYEEKNRIRWSVFILQSRLSTLTFIFTLSRKSTRNHHKEYVIYLIVQIKSSTV